MLTVQVQFPDLLRAIAAVDVYNRTLEQAGITVVSLRAVQNIGGALVVVEAPLPEFISGALVFLHSCLVDVDSNDLANYLRVLGGDMRLYS